MSATADWYERAAVELAATSELQVAWARTVASDPELLELIDRLPREHRQPSLLFSVASWCGAPAVADPSWRHWIVTHWPAIEDAARTRRTQTNEVGRCIPLLLGLDRIRTGPIALLELGAAAGLCLALDRYSYRFDDGPVLGVGAPLLTTTTTGAGTAPIALPDIVWRRGVDLAPLDVTDADDVRWLDALLPPDRPERRARLARRARNGARRSAARGRGRRARGAARRSRPPRAPRRRARPWSSRRWARSSTCLPASGTRLWMPHPNSERACSASRGRPFCPRWRSGWLSRTVPAG